MKHFKLFIIFVLISSPLAAFAAEQTEEEKLLAVQRIDIIDKSALMIGMGLTQLMSDDYYIGAFYLDEAVQYDGSDEFMFVEVARCMEFRMASTSNISARSFARKLAESIRINNERDEVSAHSSKLGRFIRMFRGTYKKGDVLRFYYHQNFGTRITLNDRVLGEIENSAELYKLLIKVWVGERPPSSKFKEGIMGNNDGNYAVTLLKKFVAL